MKYRVLYYDNEGLVDISFGYDDKEQAKEYAEAYSKKLLGQYGVCGKVTYKIKKYE